MKLTNLITNMFKKDNIQINNTNQSTKKQMQNNNLIADVYDTYHRTYLGEVHPDNDYENLYKHVNNKLVSLNWTLLNNLWKDSADLRRAVQLPIQLATRHRIKIKTNQLDIADISKVITKFYHTDIELSTSIFSELNRAEELRQLFGGVYIILDDGQDMDKEFNINSGFFHITACSIWDLHYTSKSPTQTQKQYLTDFYNQNQGEYYYFYGQAVHKSRILKFKTNYTITFYTRITRGWGLSIIEHLKTPLLQLLSLRRLMTEYVADGKLNVLKLHDYRTLLSSQSDTAVQNFFARLKTFEKTKNSMSLAAIDSQDDYEYKTLNLSGFDGIVKATEERFASAVGMSRALFLGEVQSGLGSDMNGFNNDLMFVESKQRELLTLYEPVVNLIIAHLFKIEVNDLNISFDSVQPLNDVDKSTKNNNILQTIQMALGAGLITTEEARNELIKQNVIESIEL